MNKVINIFAIAILFFSNITVAETFKVKSICFQTNDYSNLYLLVPITLQYPKMTKGFDKLLHLKCTDGLCKGMTMNRNIANNEISLFDFIVIDNLKRTVNKPGYAVLEWGLNLVTIDFNNKKVTWNETGTTDDTLGSGTATCN